MELTKAKDCVQWPRDAWISPRRCSEIVLRHGTRVTNSVRWAAGRVALTRRPPYRPASSAARVAALPASVMTSGPPLRAAGAEPHHRSVIAGRRRLRCGEAGEVAR